MPWTFLLLLASEFTDHFANLSLGRWGRESSTSSTVSGEGTGAGVRHAVSLSPPLSLAPPLFNWQLSSSPQASSPSITNGAEPPAPSAAAASVPGGDGLLDADLCVWVGDFNYRIDLGYEETLALIQAGKASTSRLSGSRQHQGVHPASAHPQLEPLRKADQCSQEMSLGRVFAGLQEGPLSFQPTYKFDKGVPGRMSYDSSEKRRVPAWTDRVLFRGGLRASASLAPVSLHCSEYGALERLWLAPAEVRAGTRALSLPSCRLRAGCL